MAIDTEFLKSIGVDDESIAEKLISKTVEDEQGLVSKRDELLGKVTKYKEDLSKYEGVDLDEYSKLKKRMSEIEEKNLIDGGEFEQVKQKMLEQFEAEKNEIVEGKTKLMGQLEGMMVDSAIISAINEANGNAKLLTPLMKQRVQAVDKDGEIAVKVFDKEGKPAVNGKGEPLTINDLIDELKSDDDYAGAFNASGLSGGGARRANGSPSGDDSKLFGASRMAAARKQ